MSLMKWCNVGKIWPAVANSEDVKWISQGRWTDAKNGIVTVLTSILMFLNQSYTLVSPWKLKKCLMPPSLNSILRFLFFSNSIRTLYDSNVYLGLRSHLCRVVKRIIWANPCEGLRTHLPSTQLILIYFDGHHFPFDKIKLNEIKKLA